MGVDCVISLPPSTRVDDVADVIGKLLGQPHQMVSFAGPGRGYYCQVEGVATEGIKDLPACAHIMVQTPERSYQFLYHFEFGQRGNRGLMPRSTPLNIAIGWKLAGFFGGKITYRDSMGDAPDYRRPAVYPNGMPEDGQPWQALQDKIAGVKPITLEEREEARQWASYKEEE